LVGGWEMTEISL